MKYLDYPFRVSTGSGRRPTPSAFAHIHNYAELIEQFLRLSSQADMVNVTELLDLVGNLYVSNKISRVIAQVIGEVEKGWITIKGTDAGALHVHVTNPANEVKGAVINESTLANNQIIALVTGKKICIHTLVFTVDGEVDITLNSDANPLSGPMDFGGTGEPKGMVSNHGSFPLKTNLGEAFKINSSAAVQLSGYCLYYEE